jgi:hypothetical protein
MAPTVRSVDASDASILNARQPFAPAAYAITLPTNGDSPSSSLHPRQQGGIVPIPTVYQGLNSGPAPGAVVGIVLGSVLGFIFLIWLLWILSNGSTFIKTNRDEEEDIVVSRHRTHTSDRRRERRSEMSQKASQPSQPPPRSPRRDRVYRQERISRDFPIPPRSPGVSRVRGETVFVERETVERRVDGDDIVEVIEEHSSVSGAPPPRRKSKRASSGYRSVSNFQPSPQPPGGFRTVDPDQYAGGNYPQWGVR